MAKENNEEQQNDTEQENNENNEKKQTKGRLPQWAITAVVAVVFAGFGFGLGRLLAGPRGSETTPASQQEKQNQLEDLTSDNTPADSDKLWYYDLDPVVACLDEPDVRRYVRASLTLAISPQMDPKKGTDFLEMKKPIIINWLTIYLASLTLEDVRGERNLKLIQLQVLDTLNEKLFPNSQPQIKKILFKEFAIQ